MEKYFNTAGICHPQKHYMVTMSSRLEKIRMLIARGEYFAVNRARQYGKTTLLRLLRNDISQEYSVFFISFEGMEKEVFAGASPFCQRVCRLLYNALSYNTVTGIPESLAAQLLEMCQAKLSLADLSDFISGMCSQAEKGVILIIDEADQGSNYDIFLSFLGMLRSKFLMREDVPTFQSVILAGVYDIKNLKLKIRPDAEHRYNSPWNIAAKFDVDMSFSPFDIAQMLRDYENDRQTGMDLETMAGLIFDYTSGYPFLVSGLCKEIDENLAGTGTFEDKSSAWTRDGLAEAVKRLLSEPNTLFDDMAKKLDDFPTLRKMLYAILFCGEKIPFHFDSHPINIGAMFGLIRNSQGSIAISNRIFEMWLYRLFLAEESLDSRIYKASSLDKNRFVCNGSLNMKLILERFVESFTDIYSDAEESFLEENGRRFFLLYLTPIINGVGNYYVEARTRDLRRTDVIIDYCQKQYVCELKIWHGEEHHKRGEAQLIGYLDDYHLSTGYMISFNFNKKKSVGVREIEINGKTLVEAVV